MTRSPSSTGLNNQLLDIYEINMDNFYPKRRCVPFPEDNKVTSWRYQTSTGSSLLLLQQELSNHVNLNWVLLVSSGDRSLMLDIATMPLFLQEVQNRVQWRSKRPACVSKQIIHSSHNFWGCRFHYIRYGWPDAGSY